MKSENGGGGGGGGAVKIDPLLDAWYDPLATLKGVSSACIRLADLYCDGDSKLCICDQDKNLKVYKGTTIMGTYKLLDTPVAIEIIFTDNTLPRIPSIAVAAGSHIFIYRQLHPYRKWTCPALEISKVEQDIWRDLRGGTCSPALAIRYLTEARASENITLSARSIELLSYVSEGESENPSAISFIEDTKDAPFSQWTLVTCMTALNKESEESEAVNLLVVGTEAGQVYILPQDPGAQSYLNCIQLPSVPTMICTVGMYDVEWRISVTCRDGKLYSIKNGEVKRTAILSGTVVDLGTQAVAMCKQDKGLWIATMERLVTCYSNRGKRIKGIVTQQDVTEICLLNMKRSKLNSLLLVALADGEVSLYRDLTKIHSFTVKDPITAMVYGNYGREENALLMLHVQGALSVKIWKRSVDADSMTGSTGPPPEQDIPLPVPKKTKLYVEQTQRERDQAPEIHRSFQRDLCKMRLTTARAYVKTLTDGFMGVTPLGSQDIRVQVQVQGLGPKFLIKMTLQNGSPQPITQSVLLFSFDPNLYVMGHEKSSQHMVPVPILLPGPKHLLETHVLCIDPQGRSGQISILLCNGKEEAAVSSIPLLSASVRMPTSEPLL